MKRQFRSKMNMFTNIFRERVLSGEKTASANESIELKSLTQVPVFALFTFCCSFSVFVLVTYPVLVFVSYLTFRSIQFCLMTFPRFTFTPSDLESKYWLETNCKETKLSINYREIVITLSVYFSLFSNKIKLPKRTKTFVYLNKISST